MRRGERTKGAGRRLPAALVAVAVAVGAAAWGASASAQAAPLRLGITYNRESPDPWNDRAAVRRARALIPRVAELQNQHIMGWGALNPEPAPGVLAWGSLDRRMRLIEATGGTPVITLCCAPDWMKQGVAGQTDWATLERAPARSHFPDFADLARRVAQRYPSVRYYQVWNELKGFYDPVRNRWDHESYTELYNLVYDALKSVNPRIQVGGPYVPVDSWSSPSPASHPSTVRGPWGVLDQRPLDTIEYWLAHKHGADFISVDADTATKDRGLATDPFTATRKFAAVDRWLRTRTSLPIWWSEWGTSAGTGGDRRMQRAVSATGVLEMAASGASVALSWGPQAQGRACGACLWTDTRSRGGGRPTPTAAAFAALRPALDRGDARRAGAAPRGAVLGFRVDGRCYVINRTDERIAARCGSGRRSLGPYGVGWAR